MFNPYLKIYLLKQKTVIQKFIFLIRFWIQTQFAFTKNVLQIVFYEKYEFNVIKTFLLKYVY